MKSFLGIILLLFITISATVPNSKIKEQKTINGTWELISHYIYDGTNITDTIIEKDTGGRQIKMYNNNKVMWTRIVPSVSAEWFGYGSYKTTEDRLFETLEYGSSSMMEMMDSIEVFEFELIFNNDSFSQITLDSEGYRVHSENYIRID
ncbi:hypothetical protein [uncultured Croceitalea sp.]|uniref:hypothetical protein n=1 Tax=uncultured Croceitalea sp. TaxID=1798908 RepID=UPI00374F38A0